LVALFGHLIRPAPDMPAIPPPPPPSRPLVHRIPGLALGALDGLVDGLVGPRGPEPAPQANEAGAVAERAPTVALAQGATPIQPRQTVQTSTIPAFYGALYSGPDPGTVVGIVLGSVGGFIVLLWLLYTCINIGNPADASSSVGTASVVTRKTRRSSRHHHHRRSRGEAETVEIRTSSRAPATVIVEEERDIGPERIVVEERRRSVSRGPPPPMPAPRVVEDDDDEVVVIEEQSPPRRRRSRSKRGSAERRSSGYRDIDPDRFAGGDSPMREIRRSSSRR
jgi:hypothetical protein